jgi:hypothetical protein
MQLVPFDARVPEWSPGGYYGHPRHLSCSCVLWPVHQVPGCRSVNGTDVRTIAELRNRRLRPSGAMARSE